MEDVRDFGMLLMVGALASAILLTPVLGVGALAVVIFMVLLIGMSVHREQTEEKEAEKALAEDKRGQYAVATTGRLAATILWMLALLVGLLVFLAASVPGG